MTYTEVDEMLIKYHSQIAQLPKIYEDDPGVVAVNGKIGDVIKITRSADTENFRLVIPRPDSGLTESTAILDMIEKAKLRKQNKMKLATKKPAKKAPAKKKVPAKKKTTKKPAKIAPAKKKTTKKAAKKATKKSTKK